MVSAMNEPQPPAALKVARPAMFGGMIVAIAGAAMVSGRVETGLSLFWEIMILAVGVAVLVFGLLALLAWRILQAALLSEMNKRSTGSQEEEPDSETVRAEG